MKYLLFLINKENVHTKKFFLKFLYKKSYINQLPKKCYKNIIILTNNHTIFKDKLDGWIDKRYICKIINFFVIN